MECTRKAASVGAGSDDLGMSSHYSVGVRIHSYTISGTWRSSWGGAVQSLGGVAKSNVPMLGYTVPYAVSNTLLTLWGMVIVLLTGAGSAAGGG